VEVGEGGLVSEAKGEVEKDGKVLVIRRIRVHYRLKVAPEQRETAERVHGFHADYCPVARTISDCVEIETFLEMD
jgi:uncharacterized OsmC-like protein